MQSNPRSNRKEKIGVVVSDKMDKTITVQIERVMHHPVYDRNVGKATKFKAHDEANAAKVGDVVRIQETRPLSKTKRWRLIEVVKRAAAAADEEVKK
ncbi:MAG: 30S ribosomal protein S17 [Candidatus Omnitrophica bacterium]|nr:30S ribosomal protein S17 [Candidatus Omnitrophota bacterium]MDD5436794.1 30S ribosomal protein S17 [Candidatus Omnitrophota bacterium]